METIGKNEGTQHKLKEHIGKKYAVESRFVSSLVYGVSGCNASIVSTFSSLKRLGLFRPKFFCIEVFIPQEIQKFVGLRFLAY